MTVRKRMQLAGLTVGAVTANAPFTCATAGQVVTCDNTAGALNGGQSRTIQRWTGTAWQTLGLGANQSVLSLAVLPSGAFALLVGQAQRWHGGDHVDRQGGGDGVAGRFELGACCLFFLLSESHLVRPIPPGTG